MLQCVGWSRWDELSPKLAPSPNLKETSFSTSLHLTPLQSSSQSSVSHNIGLKNGTWKMGSEKNYLKKGSRHPTGKRHNSLQVSTKHSCNHHHHQRLFPPLINGRLAVVYSYGSEVGTFWRLSTLCCFYAWKAVWSLNRLPCCPVSPNLINHDIRLQSVYACIDRAFRFYFWGAGSRRKNPQSWISLSSSGRTMNGHNYSFFCSVKSK